jgi:hypothetical protein
VQTQNIANGAVTSILALSSTGSSASGVINMSGGALVINASLAFGAGNQPVTKTLYVYVNGNLVRSVPTTTPANSKTTASALAMLWGYSGAVSVSVSNDVIDAWTKSTQMDALFMEVKR